MTLQVFKWFRLEGKFCSEGSFLIAVKICADIQKSVIKHEEFGRCI